MPKPNLLRRLCGEAGPLVTAGVIAAALFAVSAPASAQFFDFLSRRPPQAIPGQPGQPPQRGFNGGFGSQFQQMFPGGAPAQPARPVDFSHAPPPEKRETPAERNVLVLGDAMADWLAYGLEDAFAEQEPDLGVIRKHKTTSGLIRYQPKGEPADWAAAAKTILAGEKPDAIVVMLGLNDRVPIREPDKAETKTPADKKDARSKGADTAGETKPADGKSSDTEQAADDADGETPSILAPEKSARGGVYDFREDRWVELYTKKVEEMIAILKAKGVPVVWVGLPAVRGPKATSDMLFLDALYRDEAGKAGITYVDVWDGFVDEAGRFMPQGPDFEGQIRRLRSGDGVFFTRAGARKLAHYVEREVTRLLASRSAPLTLPNEPGVPEVNARPGGAAPRPLAGPVVPLVASSVGTDELLGGPGTRPAAVDALAARTLVKGEALAAPAGRADDYAWPHRDVERFDPTREAPVAGEPAGKSAAPVAAVTPEAATPAAPAAKKKKVQPAASPGLFGVESHPAPAVAPAVPARPKPPRDGAPRPPGSIGRAASAPDNGFFFTR
ncbi:MAG: DUF459 domain-containing protein [Xanthobacteraceae bacterium]